MYKPYKKIGDGAIKGTRRRSIFVPNIDRRPVQLQLGTRLYYIDYKIKIKPTSTMEQRIQSFFSGQ